VSAPRVARPPSRVAGRAVVDRSGSTPMAPRSGPTEATAIVQASEAIVSGASLRSAWDRQWTSVAVRDMLRRARNAGLTSYGQETFPAVWPAIVPETTWRAVVSILSNPQRRTTSGNRVRWLGSGLSLCGDCGQPALRVSHSGGGKRQPAYRCRARATTRRQTGHVARAATQLDDYVQRLIVARLLLRPHRNPYRMEDQLVRSIICVGS
jgi:site-specific DNA recombinase